MIYVFLTGCQVKNLVKKEMKKYLVYNLNAIDVATDTPI